jgi:hypothetical protein
MIPMKNISDQSLESSSSEWARIEDRKNINKQEVSVTNKVKKTAGNSGRKGKKAPSEQFPNENEQMVRPTSRKSAYNANREGNV